MKTSNPIPRDELIATIRAAVKEAGGKLPTFCAFLRDKKIPNPHFYRHFSRWDEALMAAGFDVDPHAAKIPEERLLADWGEVVRKFKRVPSAGAYNIHGKYCRETLSKRFGSFRNMMPEFKKFAKGKAEWEDVLAICAKHPFDNRGRPLPAHRLRRLRMRRTGGKFAGDRPVFGAPLHLPGLCNAPVSETGVVFLFGMMAARLGFHIQSLQSAFPDCTALREIGLGRWQPVYIEFEYESRNFRDHNHDPKGCDYIVCWTHNWPDCPRSIEVIALKDEVERLLQFHLAAERLPNFDRPQKSLDDSSNRRPEIPDPLFHQAEAKE